MKELLFFILCLIHCLIWLFVLLAFINKKTAKINLFYVIPLIYILQILPFHILVESKKKMYPTNYLEREENDYKKMIIPYYFNLVTDKLNNFCFRNPFNAQGMLIFGLISSAYALKNN